MTNAEHAADGGFTGGRGRLAQVIATRGGTAAPEAPFVIEHREALIYMLCEACLEERDDRTCQYLFARLLAETDGRTKGFHRKTR